MERRRLLHRWDSCRPLEGSWEDGLNRKMELTYSTLNVFISFGLVPSKDGVSNIKSSVAGDNGIESTRAKERLGGDSCF